MSKSIPSPDSLVTVRVAPAPFLKISKLFGAKRCVFYLVFLLTILICGLPLFNLIRLALMKSQFEVLRDPSLGKVILNTLKLGIWTTMNSLSIGTLCAYFIARTNLPFKKFFKSFLLYPYIVPPFITAIGWTILANGKNGLLKTVFPWIDIYTMSGIIFVESLYWYTYVLLNVTNVLENMDSSLEESARMCGASPVRIFFNVTLPLLRPTLIGSGLIVFICTISSFGVPAIIGGPGKIAVLTTKIYQWIKIGTPHSIVSAMTLSLPILVVASLIVFVSERWLKNRSFATMTGKSNRQVLVRLGSWKWPLVCFLILLCLCGTGLPVAMIFVTSLMKSYGVWEFSFDNFKWVLSRPETLASLYNSFALSLSAAVVLTLMSFFLAYYREKTSYRFRNFITNFTMLPYAAPSTIFALAILFSLNGLHPVWLLFFAYCGKYLSHGIKVMSPAIINVHKSLEEASLMCGATWSQSISQVWLPILKGALSSCVFLMLVPLFSELSMSVLLTSGDFPTVGVRIFHLQEYENANNAAVLAVIVLVFILSLNFAIKKFSRGKLGV